jgi:hypothetical protein
MTIACLVDRSFPTIINFTKNLSTQFITTKTVVYIFSQQVAGARSRESTPAPTAADEAAAAEAAPPAKTLRRRRAKRKCLVAGGDSGSSKG